MPAVASPSDANPARIEVSLRADPVKQGIDVLIRILALKSVIE